MKTKALMLYGKNDLRLEEAELPEIAEDEILVSVVSDSLCMSSYKAAMQGLEHKRVPPFAAETGVMLGHEFAGEILKVGSRWKKRFHEGDRYVIQPAIHLSDSPYTPGYSYRFCGGNATYAILPKEVMEQDCLLDYHGDAFFYGSLAEPYSCVIGAVHATYHTVPGGYCHHMGLQPDGNAAVLAGAGPMGLALIDYILHGKVKPKLLVITDIDSERLEHAEQLLPVEAAMQLGVRLVYINTYGCSDIPELLLKISGPKGFDDVFVFAAVESLIEQADTILSKDGCLNFFAGPMNPDFSAKFNFYKVHYASSHIVGTSGGNTEDMKEAIQMMEEGRLTPAVLVTHIGGLNACLEATLNLPDIPGGKKLIYTHINLPLTAIKDFAEKGETEPLFEKLAKICKKNNNLWCLEAEKFLLENVKD